MARPKEGARWWAGHKDKGGWKCRGKQTALTATATLTKSTVLVPENDYNAKRTFLHTFSTNQVLKQTNSVAFSPQANYTNWSTATCWRNLVPTFADRGVSRGQRDGSPTVVNLSFLNRSRYFSFIYSHKVWVDPVADPLLLRKSGNAGNRIRNLWVCSQEVWPLDHRGGQSGSQRLKTLPTTAAELSYTRSAFSCSITAVVASTPDVCAVVSGVDSNIDTSFSPLKGILTIVCRNQISRQALCVKA
jgi:hypothetical protein